jgi:hypothetical protein
MTLGELQRMWGWKPIPGCPGRLKLVHPDPFLPLQVLLNDPLCVVEEYDSSLAPDRVLVVRLVDGGLISYRRSDGSFVHTLNTPEGIRRKLLQLGIEGNNLPI